MVFDIATFKIQIQFRKSALINFPKSFFKNYNRFLSKIHTASDFKIMLVPYDSLSVSSIKFTRSQSHYYYEKKEIIIIKSRTTIARINTDTKKMLLGIKDSLNEKTKIIKLMAFVRLTLSLCVVLKGGLPFHSSAIAFDHCGIAFSGSSGAGKSTIANLLVCPGQLLNDDFNIILPHVKNKYKIYATPFAHIKTLKTCINRGAELKTIFFIEKSPTNKIENLPLKIKFLSILGQTLILPLSSFFGNKVVDNAVLLCTSVECKQLYFSKNGSIRSFIDRYIKDIL